jgi:SAM-dependent methyltransferase
MIKSKAWDWDKNEIDYWLVPIMDSCFLAESWKLKGYSKFLDLGCGLGRHSIYFGKQGFVVSAVDLSEKGINHLKSWAIEEKLEIETEQCDMLNLPFPDESFDCILAYNVIYHTDTEGFIKSLKEIRRVLKRNGELYVTLNSKNSISYQNANNCVRVDKNTILRNEHDTERDVPHFYVDIEDIKNYFKDYEFSKIPVEEIEYYNIDNTEKFSRHFKLLLRRR